MYYLLFSSLKKCEIIFLNVNIAQYSLFMSWYHKLSLKLLSEVNLTSNVTASISTNR